MENLYLWLGLGLTLAIIGVIYFSVKTGKRRAREVEELNQHFPENNEQPVTVETMRGKLRRTQRTGAEVIVKVEEERQEERQEESKAEKVETTSEESSIEEPQSIPSEESNEDSEKPVRYRRSIFHPDHLKNDQDESKTE